ncbi:hypothetical protein U8C39_31595 [Sinorhizobium meliloti]|nr:hypothetical protein U8C39_31595 [Sinorhizobium meliloti]
MKMYTLMSATAAMLISSSAIAQADDHLFQAQQNGLQPGSTGVFHDARVYAERRRSQWRVGAGAGKSIYRRRNQNPGHRDGSGELTR